MGSGGLIDIQGGTLRDGGWGRANWASNLASMNIGPAGTFNRWDDNTSGNPVRIDALTGSGILTDQNNTTTLVVGVNNGSGTFSGQIQNGGTGTMAVTKQGTGTQVLSGACTYSGATIVNNGTLEVDGSLASAVTVNTNGILDGSGTINGTVTINAGGTLAAGSSSAMGTLTLANSPALNAGSTNFMRINKGGSPTSDLLTSMTGVTYGGTLVVTNLGGSLANGDTFTLFQSGSGSYAGGFTSFTLPALTGGLSWDTSKLTTDGTIAVANSAATPTFNPPAGGYLGAQSVTISSLTAGATIYYTTNGSTPTTTSPVYSTSITVPVNATMTIQAIATAPGFATSGVGSATYGTVATPTWVNVAGGSWPVSGNWSNSVVGQGSGIMADFSQLLLTPPAVVTLDGAQTIGELLFGDVGNQYTWEIDAGTGGSLTLAGPTPPTITVLNQTTTITAPVGGSGGLTKAGNGTLELSGVLSYTGGTTVTNAGLLLIWNNIFQGDATHGTVVNIAGGTFQVNYYNVNNNGFATTFITNLTGAGVFEMDGSGKLVPFHNEGAIPSTIAMSAGGLMHVVSGTFQNSWGHASSWGNNRAGLTVEGGAVFDLWDNPLSPGYCFDALNGSGAIQSTESGNANTLNIGLASGSGSFSGAISDANGAPITLVKAGTGTQILSGTCSYTGPTIVSGGTLEVDGSLGPASAVSVNANAILDGVGTVNGPVTINSGGTLAAGTNGALGMLTIANTLALNGGSTTFMRINKGGSPASDLVTGMTGVTYGGTLAVTNLGGTLALGDTFTLFQSAVYTGGFTSFRLPALGSGLGWSWTPTNSTLTVVKAVTPPVLSSFGPWHNGAFPLTFSGSSGQTYEVLMTTNLALPLADWTVLTNGTFGANPVNYTDTSATNAQRFYRIVSP
jgi:autotransporter-associated beta strand protein